MPAWPLLRSTIGRCRSWCSRRKRCTDSTTLPTNRVQLCALVNIKSGGCPEDCAYCPQSARYSTGIETNPLTLRGSLRQHGATRLCMGAAWRPAPKGKAFERVLERVPMVRKLGMEACVTLGRVSAAQAQQLAAAGLTAYNPNLDTSLEFYPRI